MKAIYPDIDTVTNIRERIRVLDVKIDEIIAAENPDFEFKKTESFEVQYKKKEGSTKNNAVSNPVPFVRDRLVLCVGVIIISLIMAGVSMFVLHRTGITFFSVFTAVCFFVLLLINRNDRDIPYEEKKADSNDLVFFPRELPSFTKTGDHYINTLYLLADQLGTIIRRSETDNPDNIPFDNIGNLILTSEGLSFDVIYNSVALCHFMVEGVGWVDISTYTTAETIDFNTMLKAEFEAYRSLYDDYLNEYYKDK